MNRTTLITALLLAGAAGFGCEKKPQNPPTPTTQQEVSQMVAETPSNDPSLPVAGEALAAADAAARAAMESAPPVAVAPEAQDTRSALSAILERQTTQR